MKKELNERQMKLYAYLLSSDLVSREQLADDLKAYYPRCYETSRVENSTAFRLMRADIVKINNSSTQRKIISVIDKGKFVGYKLADSREELMLKIMKIDDKLAKLGKQKKNLIKAIRENGKTRFASESEVKVINTYGN